LGQNNENETRAVNENSRGKTGSGKMGAFIPKYYYFFSCHEILFKVHKILLFLFNSVKVQKIHAKFLLK
jgi:hypothetical protein